MLVSAIRLPDGEVAVSGGIDDEDMFYEFLLLGF